MSRRGSLLLPGGDISDYVGRKRALIISPTPRNVSNDRRPR